MTVDMIVLAAGLSRRMGRDKLSLPFQAGTVLSTVLDAVQEASFASIVVVTSALLAPSVAAWCPPAAVVVNERPREGQARSLSLGLGALSGTKAFAILLGDMPLVEADDLVALRERFSARPAGKTALVPLREGRFGHPSFYEPLWRGRLLEADGDRGGREVLKGHLDEVLTVDGEDRLFCDLDCPSDYERALGLASGKE